MEWSADFRTTEQFNIFAEECSNDFLGKVLKHLSKIYFKEISKKANQVSLSKIYRQSFNQPLQCKKYAKKLPAFRHIV